MVSVYKHKVPVLLNRSSYTTCWNVHIECLCMHVNMFMLQFIVSVSVYGNRYGSLAVFHLSC